MGLKRTMAVVCDLKEDGCEKSVAECSMTAREARAAAAEAGWYRQGDTDICPSCVHARYQGD